MLPSSPGPVQASLPLPEFSLYLDCMPLRGVPHLVTLEAWTVNLRAEVAKGALHRDWRGHEINRGKAHLAALVRAALENRKGALVLYAATSSDLYRAVAEVLADHASIVVRAVE